MKKLFLAAIGAAGLLAGGCASSYHPIHPPSSFYNGTERADELELSYRYDVLKERGNKKYAKKEDNKDLKLVAVKITNNTGYPLQFPEDIQLLAGDKPLHLLEVDYVYSKLKQGVPIYLLYLLFTPMKLYTTNSNGDESVTDIGYLLGPGLTALNMGRAANANNKFKAELQYYDLRERTIEAGETVYGLIGFKDFGYAPLKIALEKEEDAYFVPE